MKACTPTCSGWTASPRTWPPTRSCVLGLGSAGVETHRFDDHSDIDFFLVVDTTDIKHRYVQDASWLQGFGGQVAYSFVNGPNGRRHS